MDVDTFKDPRLLLDYSFQPYSITGSLNARGPFVTIEAPDKIYLNRDGLVKFRKLLKHYEDFIDLLELEIRSNELEINRAIKRQFDKVSPGD